MTIIIDNEKKNQFASIINNLIKEYEDSTRAWIDYERISVGKAERSGKAKGKLIGFVNAIATMGIDIVIDFFDGEDGYPTAKWNFV